MNSLLRAACLVLFAFTIAPASSNQLIDPGVDRLFKESKLVLIGRVVSVGHTMTRSDGYEPDQAALVEVEAVLKGKLHKRQIFFAYTDGGGETSFPWCCKLGEKYLIFSTGREVQGAYYSEHGHFGMYRLDKELNPGRRSP